MCGCGTPRSLRDRAARVRHARGGRRLRRRVLAERLAAPRPARARDRPPRPHRRQRLRPPRRARRARATATGRTSSTPVREGLELPVALHRVAALRAPRRSPRSTAGCCRSRSTARRSTASTGCELRTEAEVAAFYASRAEPRAASPPPRTRSSQGRPRALRDVLPRLHAQAVGARPDAAGTPRSPRRIPVRTDDDDRYFTDAYQAMPAEGYTRMFERILDHPNIEVCARRPTRRRARRGRLRPPRLHRADRRATSATASARSRTARSCSSTRPIPTPGGRPAPARGDRSTSRARTCPTRARPSTAT